MRRAEVELLGHWIGGKPTDVDTDVAPGSPGATRVGDVFDPATGRVQRQVADRPQFSFPTAR
ncbi:hypothetical protein [Nitriliruptor alkaliphilus]|uniref:hypothetical protein n=1 Tax=Nitriliruptor alkaliphilus TaxID=427918 RepID=UPI0012EE4047|nr:hypothetical protein [Nitriliruptor alkaliphilus]